MYVCICIIDVCTYMKFHNVEVLRLAITLKLAPLQQADADLCTVTSFDNDVKGATDVKKSHLRTNLRIAPSIYRPIST